MAWAVASVFVVESVIVALAALPAVVFWAWHFSIPLASPWLRIVLLAMSFVPAYVVFAIALILLSTAATRLLGWRTPRDATLRIADYAWPLLDWGRYLIITHVVRLFVGTVFRVTPLWTLFLRLNGARIGRGVFVNSLGLMDHNLLEFGDGVVVGSDAHLSGHTVERGVVRTARVRVGAHVVIGIGSVVGIGVEIGDRTQVGALSVVPKFATLAAGAVYAGAPVRRIDTPG